MIKIYNLIAHLNKKENLITIEKTNSIIYIIDFLEQKGLINYTYNPFTKIFKIYNNKIKTIKAISKPSRKIYYTGSKQGPYQLKLGEFLINNKELILYVE